MLLLVVQLMTSGGILGRPAAAQGADEAELAEARRKVVEVEAQVRTVRGAQADAEQAVRDADAQLSRLEEAVNQAAAALDRQELAVKHAAHRIDLLEIQINHQEQLFATRAADLYKRGVGAQFEAILSAGSIAEALERSAYVQALSASDQANLERIASMRGAVEAERATLTQERDQLARMKSQQERLLEKVADLRRDRMLQMASARAEADRLEHEKEDLRAESERIQERIRERERAAAEAAAEAAAKAAAEAAARAARQAAALQEAADAVASAGADDVDAAAAGADWGAAQSSGAVSTWGYAWPLCGPVTSEYGRRWGRLHEGMDIAADTGTAIRAAKSGVVIFVGWEGGYGYLTLIDHGDGVVTGYAHQSEQSVVEGQPVSQGDRIGSVGDTGESTGPHLHFETRVHGDAVDPRGFLPDWC